jgi:hypothetical protein
MRPITIDVLRTTTLEPIAADDVDHELDAERLALALHRFERRPIKAPMAPSPCVRCGDRTTIDPPTSLCGRCRRELTPTRET